MSKVKVWGKEIEDCVYCNYCSSYEPRCIIGKFGLYDGYKLGHRDDIHKDCPFSKLITKEVIEGFGFKDCNFTINTNFIKYSKSIDDVSHWLLWYNIAEDIYTIEKVVGGMYLAPFIKFVGIINNPVELEFILKSIGVIE